MAARNVGGRGLLASVFLNVPFDEEFQPLFLAYIAGVTAFGTTPRAAIEVDTGAARLDNICALIQSCRSSFHDLSRVEVNSSRPATPRFNMPFELGLAVAQSRHQPAAHSYYVFEARAGRLDKSLSDLKGVNVHVHQGNAHGIFREIGNVLRRDGPVSAPQPTVHQMHAIHSSLFVSLSEIRRRTGARSAFERQAFLQLVIAATSAFQTALMEDTR
jgi:hypothetical protein